MQISNSGISIIICFHNSKCRLKPTLESIVDQTGLEQVNWELILVDNASEDGSMSFAQSILGKASFNNIVCVSEHKPGLNYARKRGIETARYGYVLFCDDDNWLNKEYVKTAFDFLEQHEEYGVVGGNGEPVCEIEPPAWFHHYAGIYATGCRSRGNVSNVYGAGMSLRKRLLKNFKPLIEDRKGNLLTGGGDTEICDYITSQGYHIKQLCDNTFKHFVPKERLTLNFLKRTAHGRGYSKAQIQYQRNGMSRKELGIKYRAKQQLFKMIAAIFKLQPAIFLYEYQFLHGFYSFYREMKESKTTSC
ncbi:MAG: glycosyltransferase family 2 protein [Nonlabens sp.]|nr:glycosyltransferase family 2 protein [Nonlabens sp.]